MDFSGQIKSTFYRTVANTLFFSNRDKLCGFKGFLDKGGQRDREWGR